MNRYEQVWIRKPADNMNAYKYLKYTRSDFPNASSNEGEMLSLPMYPELKEEQIKYIAEKIKDFIIIFYRLFFLFQNRNFLAR